METHAESIRIINEVRSYVSEKQDLLRIAYGNKYIAVREDVVLGFNDDISELATEMEDKFPDKAVFIGTIDDIVNPREVEIPSPEVERR